MPKPRGSRLRFTGALNEPIITTPFSALQALVSPDKPRTPELHKTRNEAIVQGKRDIKLKMLCIHFGIDPDDPDCHKALAMALAIETVPGFRHVEQFPRSPGQPRSVYNPENRKTVARWEREALDNNLSAGQAINKLVDERSIPKGSSKSLEVKRLREMIRRYVKAFGVGTPDDYLNTQRDIGAEAKAYAERLAGRQIDGEMQDESLAKTRRASRIKRLLS
ncbi:MAG: hypothetical protein AB7E81_24135 [Hyphomicrobiaceae bacterium]